MVQKHRFFTPRIPPSGSPPAVCETYFPTWSTSSHRQLGSSHHGRSPSPSAIFPSRPPQTFLLVHVTTLQGFLLKIKIQTLYHGPQTPYSVSFPVILNLNPTQPVTVAFSQSHQTHAHLKASYLLFHCLECSCPCIIVWSLVKCEVLTCLFCQK